jgi:glycerol-3-phosphate dehydrogenase
MGDADLSFRTRARNLETLSRETFDVVVIGGGITGAGVARDAALRGLSVALVERRDFASGTSSRSSKLIHGGVRYLQQGDVGLVREAATERYVLRKLAPHLAQPKPLLLPVASRRGYAKISAGLWTFDRLASVVKEERYRMLGKDEALAVEALLAPGKLYGAALYYECVTDDARLVIEVSKSAALLGAVLVNYAETTSFVIKKGRVAAAKVRDHMTGDELVVRGRAFINAAGPWVDAVRLLGEPGEKPRLRLTKGIHVGLPRDRLPLTAIVVMSARDRRSVFAIPHGEVVYLGTTDTDYPEAEDDPYISLDDVEYLLDAANRTFAVEPFAPADVVSAWAGLRPLLHQEGKKPSELSRKDEIMVGATRLISVAGGKLTTFRKMAERVVDIACQQLTADGVAMPSRIGASDEVEISGGRTGPEIAAYAEGLARRSDGPGARVIERLVDLYGSNAEAILDSMDSRRELAECFGDSPVTRAEVEYAVQHEMALTLQDFLERRSRLFLWDPANGLPIAEGVARVMAELLGWDERHLAREIGGYRAHVSYVKSFTQGFRPEEPETEAQRAAHG